jgi:hypothetical protein
MIIYIYMTTIDRSPITKEDICSQVVTMGGQVTEAIETLAGTMAQKLSEVGVEKRTNGERADDNDLAKAACATDGLLSLQLHTTAFSRDTEARAHEPEVAEMRRTSEETHVSAIAVQAAVSKLLGDLDDPAIRTFELKLRHAKRLAGAGVNS